MPIDSRIALGYNVQPLDAGSALEKGMSMKRLAMQNESAEREDQERMTMNDVLKKYTTVGPDGRVKVDRGGALSELNGKVDHSRVAAFQKQMDDMDTETMARVTAQAKELAWSANPDNYAQVRHKAIELKLPNAEKLPEQYSPQFVDRWQIGTLEGEKQLAYRQHKEDMAMKYATLRDGKEDRKFQQGVKLQEVKERQVEQDMQKLSKDVSGTQEMVGALDEVEKELGSKIDSFTTDGDVLRKDGKAVDLPGVSIPGMGRVTAYDTKARNLNSAASRVFNATLKDRSGGAVTDNEMERLKREFNEGKYNTEPELVSALQRYKRQTIQVLKNREAAYNPEVVARYTEQGGRTSKTIPVDTQAAAAPQPDVQQYAQQHGISYDQALSIKQGRESRTAGR